MEACSRVIFSAIGKAKKKKKGIRVVKKLLSVTAWATEMVTVFTAPPLSNFMGSDCYLFFLLKIAIPFPHYTLQGTMSCSVIFNFK